MPARKWRLPALPVLTYLVRSAVVLGLHHFRLSLS